MVGHEAKGMNLPIGLDRALAQGCQEQLRVARVAENRFEVVATTHNVVDRSGVLDTQLASHEERFIKVRTMSTQLMTSTTAIGQSSPKFNVRMCATDPFLKISQVN